VCQNKSYDFKISIDSPAVYITLHAADQEFLSAWPTRIIEKKNRFRCEEEQVSDFTLTIANHQGYAHHLQSSSIPQH
jgi:hypothetical protein